MTFDEYWHSRSRPNVSCFANWSRTQKHRKKVTDFQNKAASKERKYHRNVIQMIYLVSSSLSLNELNYKEKRVYKTKNDAVFSFSRRDYVFTYHAQNGQIHEFTLEKRAFSRSRLRLHSRIHAQKKVNSRIHDLKKDHSRVHADRWGSLLEI